MMLALSIFFFCCFSLLAADSSPPSGDAISGVQPKVLTATNSMPEASDWISLPGSERTYRLRAGDKISFQVKEDKEPSKVLVVADSGDLDFPCLGRVMAAGKTCSELADEV